MKQLICLLLITATIKLWSQENITPKVYVKLGYSSNQFAMNQINESVIDYYIEEIERLDTRINSGSSLNFSFGFNMFRYLDIGLDCQYSTVRTEYERMVEAFTPNGLEQIVSYQSARVRSTNFHFSTNLLVNQLFDFKNETVKKVNQRFIIGFENSIGIGFGSFDLYFDHPAIQDWWGHNIYRANGLSLNSGISLEVILSKKQIFSSIGFRAGYQFYRTSNLQRYSGDEIIGFSEFSPNLDFSGFYYGIYLKLGK
jgi:hypothetical protein